MKKYRVVFEPEAEEEILFAYYWGVDHWGEYEAERWLQEMYSAVFGRLSSFPLSCSVAPESDSTDGEVRHYLFRRYRILFEVDQDRVIVLHISGPYRSKLENEQTSDNEDIQPIA